jgi:hypothetical protein
MKTTQRSAEFFAQDAKIQQALNDMIPQAERDADLKELMWRTPAYFATWAMELAPIVLSTAYVVSNWGWGWGATYVMGIGVAGRVARSNDPVIKRLTAKYTKFTNETK